MVPNKLTFHLWAKLDYLVLLMGWTSNGARIAHSHCVQVDVGFTILGHFQMGGNIYIYIYIYVTFYIYTRPQISDLKN